MAQAAASDRSVFLIARIIFPTSRNNGTDESHEGHESRKRLDPNRSVRSSGGKSWHEVEGSESCSRRPPRRGGGTNEKKRIFQARRRESEAQEQGRHEGTQGHQPVHQGAVCDQGEAGIQDRAWLCHEKTEGDGQLK